MKTLPSSFAKSKNSPAPDQLPHPTATTRLIETYRQTHLDMSELSGLSW